MSSSPSGGGAERRSPPNDLLPPWSNELAIHSPLPERSADRASPSASPYSGRRVTVPPKPESSSARGLFFDSDDGVCHQVGSFLVSRTPAHPQPPSTFSWAGIVRTEGGARLPFDVAASGSGVLAPPCAGTGLRGGTGLSASPYVDISVASDGHLGGLFDLGVGGGNGLGPDLREYRRWASLRCWVRRRRSD